MEEQVYNMPLIGEKAPSFKAVTTQCEMTFTKMLDEFKAIPSH